MNAGLETDLSGWQDDEIVTASLPDKRLQRRLQRLLEQLSTAPGKPVPAACGDWAATKAAYRFFDNPRVTEHGVLAGHFAATAARCKANDGPILILQDTTEFIYNREAPGKIDFTKTINGGRYKAGQPLFRMAPLACTLSAAILGQTLGMLRKNKNMTQEDMANAMGISISSWGRIEKGESDMSVIELSTAAEIFGTTPAQILDASKAGENEAQLQGVRVVVGAGSDSDLARLFEERGARGGGTSPGRAVIPVKGTFLGGFIGTAVAAVLNRDRDKDFVIPPEANQTYKLTR